MVETEGGGKAGGMKFRQRLARRLLRLLGWTLVDLPERPRQAVLVVYPHTSNWDFPYGILGKTALGLSARWAGKDSLFRPPLGPLMRWLGGIPINRRAPAGVVDQLAEELRRGDFLLAITPEGTRSLRPGWKSGFLRIAHAADLPVMIAIIDFGRQRIGVVDCFRLSGDDAADIARIAADYADCRGRRPQLASPIRLL